MSKHTPGPWAIDWNVSRLDVFSSDAATLVATLRRSALSGDMDARAIANARLIAAAPELLEALKLCQKRLLCMKFAEKDYVWELFYEAVMQANAAIAKAEGA